MMKKDIKDRRIGTDKEIILSHETTDIYLLWNKSATFL